MLITEDMRTALFAGSIVVAVVGGILAARGFLNSLETLAPGALKPDELTNLTMHFKDAYFSNYRVGSSGKQVKRSEYAKAERWYQLEMELAIIKPGDAAAKARVLALVGETD